jgi:hypothetical protein
MSTGMLEYTKPGFESAAKSFNPADLEVDLSKRAIMVTGANSGIGKIAALEGLNPKAMKIFNERIGTYYYIIIECI